MDISDGRFAFDLAGAVQLALTPDRPNSARSTTDVQHLGKPVGTLTVAAFQMDEGTGNEPSDPIDRFMSFGPYPRDTKVIPRSKAGVFSEAHLTIAAIDTHGFQDSPLMYVGNLDLVGYTHPKGRARLGKLATLGQDPANFYESISRNTSGTPTATLSTGFIGAGARRFGDPHAIFNNTRVALTQVAGFVTLPKRLVQSYPNSRNLLAELGARTPDLQLHI